ncbi:MAG TPA: M28 family peptidase [Thermoanaerobaculia bacterium]|nr:M28 family peptidase [Thermoanaerobaculia bacterium]
MKKLTLLLLLILCGAAGFSPPDPEATARQLRDAALVDSEAWNAVRDLTTRFGARPAGSPAERAAAEWAAAKMTAMGLANVRVESFPLVAWKRGVERVEVLGDVTQMLAATSLGGTDPTPEAGVEGELAIFATLDELLAAKPGSLAGKIAMINYQMPRLETGEGYNLATVGRGEGPREAAKRGAIGYVMRSAGTGTNRFPHTGSARFHEGRVPLPAFAVSAPDADQLVRLAASGPVRLRLFSTGKQIPGASSQNVIGEIPGTKADEILLIGAHLDSWDLGTGAIDDGAGVGVMFGIAKLLHALPQKPRRTIRIVLFGAEEVDQPAPPLLIIGGSAFASAYERDLSRFALASECDLGAGRVIGLSLPGDWANSDLAAGAARVLLPLGVLIDATPAPHGGADMYPLQLKGVPVFLLRQDATHYFDLHHTADDTLDKIDPAELRQVVAAWVSFVWLAAEGDEDFRKPPATK